MLENSGNSMVGINMANREDDELGNPWQDRISLKDLHEAATAAEAVAKTLLDKFDNVVEKLSNIDNRLTRVERDFDIFAARQDQKDTHEIQIGGIWEARIKANEKELQKLKEAVPANHEEEHKELGEKISAFPMDRLLLILATAGAVVSAIVGLN